MSKPAREKVLVVGGAGYIGSVLIRKLMMYGYHVTALDNLLYDNGGAVGPLIEKRLFGFIKGDFCDAGISREALEGIDHVVLLAALVGDPLCKKYPEEAVRVNDKGTREFLELCSDAGIKRLVFMSTCSNYGLRNNDQPAGEEEPLNPKSLYAETKVKIEKELLDNSGNHSFAPIILRCATAMGQSYRMRFDLTVSEFTREIALGKELLVYDENTWRPYYHVSDISEVIVRMLKASIDKVGGEVFNVGSDTENYTKQMIVDEILKQIPEGKVRYGEGGSDPRNYRVSFAKLDQTIDYLREYTLPVTISHLIKAVSSKLYHDVETRKNFYGNYRIPG